MTGLLILAVISAVATLVVLMIGVVNMGKDNDFNKKYGNRLMQLRVGLQALTLLLLFLVALAA